MKQLAPILNDFEVVGEKNKKFVLKHPNGKTVNQIIKEKLSEASGTTVPPEIQGEKVDVVSKEEIKAEKSNVPALGHPVLNDKEQEVLQNKKQTSSEANALKLEKKEISAKPKQGNTVLIRF